MSIEKSDKVPHLIAGISEGDLEPGEQHVMLALEVSPRGVDEVADDGQHPQPLLLLHGLQLGQQELDQLVRKYCHCRVERMMA